jgi:4'-phosphopantetheinyl transferase EntD
MTTVRYLSRQEAQQIPCPQCSAPVGEPCIPAGVRGTHSHNHAARVNAAAALLDVVLPHQRRRGVKL